MRRFTIGMTLLIVILFAISLVVGAVDIPVKEVVNILLERVSMLPGISSLRKADCHKPSPQFSAELRWLSVV